MMGRKRTRAVGFVCLVFWASGCYSYRPVATATPGSSIRARLTADAAVRRSQGLDEPILHYDGSVVEATEDSITLDVLIARSSSTFQQVEIRDTMRLATTEIQSISARRLSATKSLLVGAAAVAAGVAIVTAIDQIVGGTGDDDDGGTPTARVPLLRWIGHLETIFGRRQ